MRFSELHEIIPYARYGKAKSLTMQPYNGITLALPGRHAEDTSPKGGDFVVMVDSEKLNWTRHQFTHTDIFKDVYKKAQVSQRLTNKLMEDYAAVIDNNAIPPVWERLDLPGLHPQTFLYAVQCLGVAEHRRYHQHESRLGGRYLPLRFAAGIAQGLWTATDAAEKQRRGRPGVEWLENDYGVPEVTGDLFISMRARAEEND